MSTLFGTYECRLDEKGRLVFPAGLKRRLQNVVNNGFVLKKGIFAQCLELFPMEEWDAELNKMKKLNPYSKKNQDFIRVFMQGVTEVELDANGRLLIPKNLMNQAGLSKEVVISCSLTRVEIWDKKLYDESTVPGDDFQQITEEIMSAQFKNYSDDVS